MLIGYAALVIIAGGIAALLLFTGHENFIEEIKEERG